MKSRKKKKKVETVEIKPGTLLMAKPFWDDDAYARSVVLIVNIVKDKVAGLIVNKMATVSIKDALPDINCTDYIYFGGLVEPSEISFLHTMSEMPDAGDMGGGLCVGGDAERLVELSTLNNVDFSKVRFVAGRVEWTREMLEKEIREDKWWPSTITAKELFDIDYDTLWSFKLLQAGHTYGLFAHIPDPSIKEKIADKFDKI